jgi:hypothetical protein
MPAMADGHEADHARFALDGVGNPKAADTIFPQPFQCVQERLPALGVGQNGVNG